MKDKFIPLATKNNNPVIIGLSNISLIEMHDPTNEKLESKVTLNFTRTRDLWPKSVDVTESFTQIKSMLGF